MAKLSQNSLAWKKLTRVFNTLIFSWGLRGGGFLYPPTAEDRGSLFTPSTHAHEESRDERLDS